MIYSVVHLQKIHQILLMQQYTATLMEIATVPIFFPSSSNYATIDKLNQQFPKLTCH